MTLRSLRLTMSWPSWASPLGKRKGRSSPLTSATSSASGKVKLPGRKANLSKDQRRLIMTQAGKDIDAIQAAAVSPARTRSAGKTTAGALSKPRRLRRTGATTRPITARMSNTWPVEGYGEVYPVYVDAHKPFNYVADSSRSL